MTDLWIVLVDWEHATVVLGVYSTLEAAEARCIAFDDPDTRIDHVRLDVDVDLAASVRD